MRVRRRASENGRRAVFNVGDQHAHEVETRRYAAAPAAPRREIARRQERAYAPAGPALDARSFFIRADGRVVSYAGVVSKTIEHTGRTFTISGLSCVATDPAYQRRGLGRRVVAAATVQIAASGVDLGVFTRAPALAGFYADAGSWPVAPRVVLICSRGEGALTSASLGVVVLPRLFSGRARSASTSLLHGTISLDLPPGQFV